MGCEEARIPGVHLESPYLSPERAGAQPCKHLSKSDGTEFLRLYGTSGGSLRRIT